MEARESICDMTLMNHCIFLFRYFFSKLLQYIMGNKWSAEAEAHMKTLNHTPIRCTCETKKCGSGESCCPMVIRIIIDKNFHLPISSTVAFFRCVKEGLVVTWYAYVGFDFGILGD